MTKIEKIKLSTDFSDYLSSDKNIIEDLSPISRINIFVGENNSGKSRFVRQLATQSEYKVKLNNYSIEEITSKIKNIISEIVHKILENGLTEVNFTNVEKINQVNNNIPDYLSLSVENYIDVKNNLLNLSKFHDISSYTGNPSPGFSRILLSKYIVDKSLEGLNLINQLEEIPIPPPPKRVYIPIMRGLRNLDNSHTDLFAERTIKDYFNDESRQPEIFTGLTFFERLTDLLLGDNKSRKLISRYQEFLSKSFFGNQPVALIPNQKSNTVVIKIGAEKEQPISNLGDGIQSAIIMSFLPYVVEESTFFFIEEPEMYLHPGLQRKILELFSQLNQHTFFLTTHSNHFLDISIDIKDISVFSVRKQLQLNQDNTDELNPSFIVESLDCDKSSSLELLGVRNSSVFLVNSTVFVEGITDRWYLREMLNSYLKFLSKSNMEFTQIEEDIHYSFVEYGGSNITHWSFLDYEEHPIEVDRLCARAIVIIDKDGKSKLKRKRDLQNMLNDRLIILPCREIENLLPYKTLCLIVQKYEGSLDINFPDFTWDKYKNVSLGQFIENDMLKNNFSRIGGYKDNSGTIKNKVDFCEKALPLIKYQDLDSEARVVIQKIYNFILNCNK